MRDVTKSNMYGMHENTCNSETYGNKKAFAMHTHFLSLLIFTKKYIKFGTIGEDNINKDYQYCHDIW